MKADNYVTVQGWMRTELGLKGNDLLVYAIIYGFSQTENQSFNGSLQYLADWCGATKQGILNNLKHLIQLGLIEKKEVYNGRVKLVEYYSTKLNGVFNKVERGIEQSSINNISNKKANNKLFISKDINNSQKPAEQEVQSFIDLYHEVCTDFPKVKKITDKRKIAILNIISNYKYGDIKTVFYHLQESDFCKGDNDRGWKADIDFVLREDKFVNLLEGKYSNSKSKDTTPNKFGEFTTMQTGVYTEEELNALRESNQDGKRTHF